MGLHFKTVQPCHVARLAASLAFTLLPRLQMQMKGCWCSFRGDGQGVDSPELCSTATWQGSRCFSLSLSLSLLRFKVEVVGLNFYCQLSTKE